MNELQKIQDEIKRLEIQQETNKALKGNIMKKLKEQGIDTIDDAKITADTLKQEIADLRREIDEDTKKLKEMIDEYKRGCQ